MQYLHTGERLTVQIVSPFLFLASLSRILRKTGQFYTGNEPMQLS